MREGEKQFENNFKNLKTNFDAGLNQMPNNNVMNISQENRFSFVKVMTVEEEFGTFLSPKLDSELLKKTYILLTCTKRCYTVYYLNVESYYKMEYKAKFI